VPGELDGAIVTNDFWLFEIDQKLVDATFLDYYVGTPTFVGQCLLASEGTTNRVRLQPERFLRIRVPLPSLDQQRRSVSLMEQTSGLLDEAEKLRKTAVAAGEAMGHSIAVDLLRSKAGWTENTIEGVCTTIVDNLHRNPVYTEAGVPCVRSPDVGWGELNLDTARTTSESEYQNRTVRGEPTPGDVVFVREGGGTGKAAIVRPGQRFSLGQRVMMLRPNPEVVVPDFLLEQLLSPLIQEEQIRPRILGSASPHLNIGSLRRFRFLLPPIDEQWRIVARFARLRDLLSKLRSEQELTSSAMVALRGAAIDQAFRHESN
jgi:type I restriction enzyme S subunit